MPTTRLYLDDAYCFEHEAVIVAVDGSCVRLDVTCMYPGGGGQPADAGLLVLPDGREIETVSEKDASGYDLLHRLSVVPEGDLLGQRCMVRIDRARRYGLMRHHTVLHVLNTVMMRDFNAWITGVGMSPDHSHIDFKIEGYDETMRARAQDEVNAVLARDLPTRASWVTEAEYHSRPELRRTLDVVPPMQHGKVRVVEIGDFDTQACGGTHVRSTNEVGRFTITKVKSKGRENRRFHVALADPATHA